jgi:hypothetical protein
MAMNRKITQKHLRIHKGGNKVIKAAQRLRIDSSNVAQE